MGLNAANFQALIIASLSDADPTVLETLQAQVPFFWSLHARTALPELRYWLTRRDAIRAAQACVTRQVDNIRRTMNSARTSVENSRQDSETLATSQENSISEAVRSSTSQFNNLTESLGAGANSASRSSTQSATSAMTFSDVGTGSSTQNRRMHQDTYTSEVGNVSRNDTVQYDLRHERGRDAGDGTTRNLNVYQYPNWIVDINPFDGSILPSNTAETRTKMDTYTRSVVHEHIYSADAGKGSISDPFRISESRVTLTVTPKRTVDSELYDRPVADAGASTPSAFSTFTANVDSSESANASSSMTATGASSLQTEMSGVGSGNTLANGTSTSAMVATATRTVTGDGEAHRSNQLTSQMESLLERLHQRFLHLQDLWKQADETIKLFESQRLALTPYIISQITIQYPDGIDAVTANAFLVKQPYAAR